MKLTVFGARFVAANLMVNPVWVGAWGGLAGVIKEFVSSLAQKAAAKSLITGGGARCWGPGLGFGVGVWFGGGGRHSGGGIDGGSVAL
ncbi:hypothetical protein BFV98_10985 [Micromonospora sp. WMMB235]|nr:hypothetical protein BFV98_10985 [Micromonospora sp. WMMB235]